ncbi:MAG: hypothetical protein V3V84_03120 [Candidatus Bathyarchaeia archaeon]
MINWDDIEKKIKDVSIKKTIKEKTSLDEIKVINEQILHLNQNARLFKEFFTIKSLTLEIASFRFLLSILFMTELLSVEINLLIYALMLKGHHDIWSERKQKFISSFNELFDLPLFLRLRFLNKHGFEFLSEIIPRKIRNDIAHQNFKIESDGTILLSKKGKSEKLSDKIMDKMVDNLLRYAEIMSKEFPSEK